MFHHLYDHQDDGWGFDIDDGFPEYLYAIYRYMTFGLTLSGLIAYVCANSNLYKQVTTTPFVLPILLVIPLILVIVLSNRIEQMSIPMAKTSFWLFATLIGFSFAGIFQVYLGESIAKTFFEVAGAFFILSLVGFFTKRSLTRMGTFLLLSLVSIILAGLVNIWFVSTTLDLMISAIGILIFSALTAFDTQKISNRFYAIHADCDIRNREAILGALNLYLDFINIFLSLLRLNGSKK
ncbi:MAG: Bax inhibitor-1/YccA family protein [Gammaproteobacteria bacterium]|nr:Bax inhibitor-1/YccA family protein [Gammaproteobacteria bacterium]